MFGTSFMKRIVQSIKKWDIFDTNNKKALKALQQRVDRIKMIAETLLNQTNEELLQRAQALKHDVRSKKRLIEDVEVLHESFALVMEAASRTIGQKHYDVQIIGGIVLAMGNIAEMKTGEGKTLTATLPAFYRALAGLGVHIATANDYLAKRDAIHMGKIYKFLGMTVGTILSSTPSSQRKQMYDADITYGTANEFGFDYLRDGMVYDIADVVQLRNGMTYSMDGSIVAIGEENTTAPKALLDRTLHYYAIIDEIDFVLIDESKVPLILSESTNETTQLYKTINQYVSQITSDMVMIDLKTKNVSLLENGIDFLEKILQQDSIIEEELYTNRNAQIVTIVQRSLEAHFLYHPDIDYVVVNDSILIIDHLTGRVLSGRRYSGGLHQALEAKHFVTVHNSSVTKNTITLQGYFRQYPILSGMSGTAETDKEEFRTLYGLKVILIPTHKPMIRIDATDKIYRTMTDKLEALITMTKLCLEKQQPMLIGTISIEQSEMLSERFAKENIVHRVLNAKHHETEAQIIALSGAPGAITIATNVAGRGTDIEPGGNLEAKIANAIKNVPEDQCPAIIELVKQEHARDAALVKRVGGLFVIIYEPNENKRTDLQLRGRTGRQGDPGITMRLVSLQDNCFLAYAGQDLMDLLEYLENGKDTKSELPYILLISLSKMLDHAQKQFAGRALESRKYTLRYDEINNSYRAILVANRCQCLLERINYQESIVAILYHVVDDLVETSFLEAEISAIHKQHFIRQYAEIFGIILIEEEIPDTTNGVQIKNFVKGLKQTLLIIAQQVFATVPNLYQKSKEIILMSCDRGWSYYLKEGEDISKNVSWRSYAQKDPFHEYQMEAARAFIYAVKHVMKRYAAQLFISLQHWRKGSSNAIQELMNDGRTLLDERALWAEQTGDESDWLHDRGESTMLEDMAVPSVEESLPEQEALVPIINKKHLSNMRRNKRKKEQLQAVGAQENQMMQHVQSMIEQMQETQAAQEQKDSKEE